MALRGVLLASGVLTGFAVLSGLCAWQVARALEREERIQLAAERLTRSPIPLPDHFTPSEQELTPVLVRGRFDHLEERHVLTSLPPLGPGVRVITPLDTAEGRRILVDRGFVPERLRDRLNRPESQVEGLVEVEGVLTWPRERGFFVPEPDPETGLWFARDVLALANASDSEQVLVVARQSASSGFPRADAPRPDRKNIHVEYAVTWAALAVAWAVIGGLLWRREVAGARRRGAT